MTWATFAAIVAVHFAAAASPGPCFVVCIRTAASEGFAVAAALALGFGIGAALWAAAAMAGVALIFEVMPAVFMALKIVGGAFLLYVASQMWRHAATPLDLPKDGAAPRGIPAAIRFGFVTFAANPKTAVFFGAVFAGLVPSDTPLIWRVAILLAVFINECGWYLIVARIFAQSRAKAAYTRLKTGLDRAAGTLIALFGLKIVVT